MKTKLVVSLFVLTVVILSGCSPVQETTGGIEVSNVWARPSQMMAGNGAVYMNISNNSGQDDRLVSASSSVAETVEIHQTTMVDDVMKMAPVEGIEVPADGEAALEPGGYHIMLINLVEDFMPGDTFSVTLNFEHAGEISVDVTVQE